MTRLYIKWFLSVLLLWAAQIVGLIVVPVALAQTYRRAGRGGQLPRWAWAWGNEGNPNGDIYWHQKPWTQRFPRLADFVWLALRNRAHNLSGWLGVPEQDWYLKGFRGNASMSVADDSRAWTGRLYCKAGSYSAGARKPITVTAFEHYGVLAYPFTGGKWGIRWRLGYKIKGGVEEDRPHRLVCNVMPLRRIG